MRTEAAVSDKGRRIPKTTLRLTAASPLAAVVGPVQFSRFQLGGFNCSNFSLCYRSWNFRGCWHQTFPPIVTSSMIWGELIPIADPHRESASLLIVTTSPFWHWVICAPAAIHRSGSHLSGTHSGIKPQSSVTRQCLGKPIFYQHKLMSRKSLQTIAFINIAINKFMRLANLVSSVGFNHILKSIINRD